MAEEQYPIFKSEGEAFDRAKVESDIATSGGASVTQEIGDSMREAKKASQEASDFYNKIFKEEIKALDPAYDPNSIYYNYAYSPASSDKRKIQRSLEEGESVDGKEIVQIAKDSASNKVKNATALKTGAVTQIVEKVGIKAIKEDMESFEEVKSDFDSKIQNEDFKFEKLLSKFSEIISFFSDPLPGQQNLLYTQENNAIISALAKILNQEGFDSESVKSMSSKYDDNIDILATKTKVGIESVKETTGEQKKSETPVLSTTEQKIESKAEEKPQTEEQKNAEGKTETTGTGEKSGSVSITDEQRIAQIAEPPKESKIESASQQEAKTEANLGSEGSPKSIETTTALATKESPAASAPGTSVEGTEQKIIGGKSGANFIEEMFGGLLSASESKPPTVKEEIVGLVESMKSDKGSKPLTESIEGIESNVTGSKSSTSSAGSEKKSQTGLVKIEEKIQEKIGASPETLSKIGGIKETATQKLSSPLQAETPKTENRDTQNSSTGQGATSSEVKAEQTSSMTTEKVGDSTQASQTSTSVETKEDKGNEDLSKKMETMIALLSQLNDTLSGPLLVTSTTKKFE